MKRLILVTAISGILAGTSGCARLSPSFDKNYQSEVNTISAVRLSNDSDKRNPFDVSQILTRKSPGELAMSDEWMSLRNVRWDAAGDAAIRIVSKYSYDDIKNAMVFMSPPDVIGNGARNMDVDGYLRSAELGLRAQCQNADALYQSSCLQEQQRSLAKSVSDGGGSLFAKYNTAVLAERLIRQFGKVGGIGEEKSTLDKEGRARLANATSTHNAQVIARNSYGGVRYEQSPDYADNVKRIMAYAILLSAYEDANRIDIDTGVAFRVSNERMSPAEDAQRRQAAAQGRHDEFMANYNQEFAKRKSGSALRQWLWENSNFAFLDEASRIYKGNSWESYGMFVCSRIPYGKEEQKMLATGRKYIKGPNLNRLINQEGSPLHKRHYLGENFDTFLTNPDKHGYAQFVRIIAPRDSQGFAAYGEADPVESCAVRLSAKSAAVSIDNTRAYAKQWFDRYEENERKTYRFR